MVFDWTEEQLMLRDMIRKFTKNEVAPRDKWMDENGYDWDLHQKMVDAGIYTILIPEEYDGAGFDFVTAIMTIHEVAKGSASAALNLDCFWLVSIFSCATAHRSRRQSTFPWRRRASASASP